MQELLGRTAVVTGAASGIGRGLAERLAREGMNVVLADVEEQALDAAVRDLAARGHRVLGVATNVMQRASVEALAARAIDAFGPVHVLCNNAGVLGRREGARAVWELPTADWEWVLGVNLWGVLHGLQAFVPHMLAHGAPGHVVNTASIAAWLGGGGPYGVSKEGVVALSESLHADLRARKAKIGASVLCPGWVDTQLAHAERNRPAQLDAGGAAGDGAGGTADTALHTLPMGKAPAEIADAVVAAIRAESFYVLPHTAWDFIVRARFDAVLARGGPAQIDFAEMTKRRAAGESF
jgi:NAD(P)-dependent dehydrogenase (short-subunit alcohol dehydrogenase family)